MGREHGVGQSPPEMCLELSNYAITVKLSLKGQDQENWVHDLIILLNMANATNH